MSQFKSEDKFVTGLDLRDANFHKCMWPEHRSILGFTFVFCMKIAFSLQASFVSMQFYEVNGCCPRHPMFRQVKRS